MGRVVEDLDDSLVKVRFLNRHWQPTNWFPVKKKVRDFQERRRRESPDSFSKISLERGTVREPVPQLGVSRHLSHKSSRSIPFSARLSMRSSSFLCRDEGVSARIFSDVGTIPQAIVPPLSRNSFT